MPKRKITRVDFVPQIQQLGKAGATKLRVAAYALVSSESEEQEHSLSAQTDYFEAFIKENPLWEYVGLYVDDGVSGLSHQKRDGFNRMVANALDGKIDLIITKSLSRFARNTVDALTTIRKLKAANVGIFFQKEDINTLDAKGEFMLTLMSSFAEEESRSISENVTWGHRKRFADGNYTVPFAQFLGYDKGKNKGEFIINESEAKVVRFIYMLAFEHYPMSGIARLLQKLNVPSPSGNNNWQVCTVESILRNEKYKGDALLQKTFTIDFRTKRRKLNNGELPQYYVSQGHPPIIAPATWDAAQQITHPALGRMSKRRPMTGKVICGECGGTYGPLLWHSTTYRNCVWECFEKKFRKSQCHCSHIYDEEMQSSTALALQRLYDKNKKILQLCKELLSHVQINDLENALKALDRISHYDLVFDNSAVSILIEKAVVTQDANMIFYYIDGSKFTYRISANTPKGQRNMNIRKEHHKQMLELYSNGMTRTEIAKVLGISPNTVGSYLRRLKNTK